MKKIKVAIAGVGNCASALVQGINYYKKHTGKEVPGLAFQDIGGYSITDIEIVAAFDIDARKVGKPLNQAIFEEPNCARMFNPICKESVIVQKAFVMDGVSDTSLSGKDHQRFIVSDVESVDVVKVLRESGADILINYLPVGSNNATETYAQACIDAGVSFLNCIPVLSVNHPDWEEKFIRAGIPYVGSDMKSQFGASILSQTLQELAFSRGMHVDFHQQLNVGGNMDFRNMLDQERLKHKKVSKENVIRAQNDIRDIPVDEDSLFAGPSTWIPYLKDNKVAYFALHMRGFGDAPVTVDIKLSVQDSENSAGVVVDAVRYLKVAREMGLCGCLRGPSAFTQKSPPKQLTFEDSYKECVALANRELTATTRRQLSPEDAIQFAWEEYESGGMDYLRLVGYNSED